MLKKFLSVCFGRILGMCFKPEEQHFILYLKHCVLDFFSQTTSTQIIARNRSVF